MMDYAPDGDRVRETACRCPKKWARRIKVKSVSVKTFKSWAFASDFDVEICDGKVVEALCKYCGSFISAKMLFS